MKPRDGETRDRYRKKPVVIDACQFTGDYDALNLWLIALGCGDGEDPDCDQCPSWLNEDGSLTIATLEGDMRCEIGDWLIRGVKGEFYPCKPDIFAATYDRVPASERDGGETRDSTDPLNVAESTQPLNPRDGETLSAVGLITAERRRQIDKEGWTLAHDDRHAAGEMAIAAACYAWPNPRPLFVKQAWPWDRQWWKPAVPGDRIGFPDGHTDDERRAARLKDLVRAGALIVAEIERLQRGGDV